MTWIVFALAFLVPLLTFAWFLHRVAGFARVVIDARRRAESAGSGAGPGPDVAMPPIELPPWLEALLTKLIEARTAQLAASHTELSAASHTELSAASHTELSAASHPELSAALERARATSPVAPPTFDTTAVPQERWLRGGLLILVGVGLALLARSL